MHSSVPSSPSIRRSLQGLEHRLDLLPDSRSTARRRESSATNLESPRRAQVCAQARSTKMTVTGLTDDRIARPRTPMGILRSFINSQIWLSKHFDRLLPDEFHI